MATNEQIKKIFDSYGVPERIWKPIISTESGGNTNALNSKPTELSKGLFQINVMAHPQFANLDLYDPIINTQIAARYFIAPAYEQAKKITSDEKNQALIVYSGLVNPYNPKEGYLKDGAGIRPLWTDATRDKFLANYQNVKNTNKAKMFDDYMLDEKGNKVFKNPNEWSNEKIETETILDKAIEEMNQPPILEEEKKLAFNQNIVKIFSIILLVIIIIVATFLILGKSNFVKDIKKSATRGVKAYATGGVSEIAEGVE